MFYLGKYRLLLLLLGILNSNLCYL